MPKMILPYALLLLFFYGHVLAAASDGGGHEAPWQIKADAILYDQNQNRYEGKGNVTITREDRVLKADHVIFDRSTMTATAVGHVMLMVAGDVLTGSRMQIDLNAETGWVEKGDLFIARNHFHIRGHLIRKVGEETYTADLAEFTSCDGAVPDWKITGNALDVTLESYGTVSHAAFRIKDFPIFYSPYFIFPAKSKRQSGFLAPEFHYSKRKGVTYSQPLYWAMDTHMDATYYYTHFQKRGEMNGVEYRYMLSPLVKGTIMGDYLHDRKIDDGSEKNRESYGFEEDENQPDILRTNKDRYWLRMKNDQALPFDMTAKLDIDLVSDQDYLKEFKDTRTGYDETDDIFTASFGRNLDDYNDPIRINRLTLTKTYPGLSVNAEVRWYDDVVLRQNDAADPTLQKLPVIQANAAKQSLINTPLFFDLNSEYVNYYSEDGLRGHRVDLYPRVYWPFAVFTHLAVEPSIGYRQTFWRMDAHRQADPLNRAKDYDRGIYDFKTDMSTRLFRIFAVDMDAVKKIKHQWKPQIVYEYIPQEDQSGLPHFDAVDRIEAKNLVTYSLTHVFTVKKKLNASKERSREQGSEYRPEYRYDKWARFYLEQRYDIREARSDDPALWAHPERKSPFSPVYAELALTMHPNFSLYGDIDWSSVENKLVSRNIAIKANDHGGREIYVEHRHTQALYDTQLKSESLYALGQTKMTETLRLYGEYERDMETKTDLLLKIGAEYLSQCWSLDASFKKEQTDKKYSLTVNLFGLGSSRNSSRRTASDKEF